VKTREARESDKCEKEKEKEKERERERERDVSWKFKNQKYENKSALGAAQLCFLSKSSLDQHLVLEHNVAPNTVVCFSAMQMHTTHVS